MGILKLVVWVFLDIISLNNKKIIYTQLKLNLQKQGFSFVI